jgi:hypothetical protein
MKRFILKLAIFALINVALLALVFRAAPSGEGGPAERAARAESVVSNMPTGRSFDILIMGSSHGRTFSRAGVRRPLERILDRTVANISFSAGGVVPERIYLQYFYDRGNRASVVLYFIDPFALSTPAWNEGLYLLSYEPFRLGFLRRLIGNGVAAEWILDYVRSKLGPERPEDFFKGGDEGLEAPVALDPDLVRKRIAAMYPDGFEPPVFRRYAAVLESIARLIQRRGGRPIFAIPPTLLGRTPGHDDLLRRLERLRAERGIPFYDFASAVPEPRWYRNLDHLNEAGILMFAETALKPILPPRE